MEAQIKYLVPASVRLPLAQLPGQGGGERVRTSRTAPLPLRLDPLSLQAAGHADDEVIAAFVPGPVDEHGNRPLVPATDQGGQLPIATWCRAWATDWRQTFGHSAPAQPEPKPREQVEPTPLNPADRAALVRDVLGIGTNLPVAQNAEQDPRAREWTARFGAANPTWTLPVDCGYLTTWLPEACDRHPDIAAFATALRSLHGALSRVLGDGDDKTYLGRCPTGHHAGGVTVGRELIDRDTDLPTVCGAALWHDPHTSTIACPRCRCEWRPEDQLRLAGWIRKAWPLDRRRRYTLYEADDIQAATKGEPTELRLPTCGECGQRVAVGWKRATERGDTVSMWRIESVGCPQRCDEAGESAA